MYLLYRKDEYYKPFYRNLRSISKRNGMLYDYHEYTKLPLGWEQVLLV